MPSLASQGNSRHNTKMFDLQNLKELWLLLDWQDSKSALVEHANLSRDALHIYFALAIFLAACWLFKWRPSSWKPWLLLLAVQSTNELFDMFASLQDDGVIWIWANIKDMVNTMIGPTVLLLAARYLKVFTAEPAPHKDKLGDEA